MAAPSPQPQIAPPGKSRGQAAHHHRKAERRSGHRRRARRLPRRAGLLRERELGPHLGGRPSLRAARARGDRPRVQALDARQPPDHPRDLQDQAEAGPERAGSHHQEAARARGRRGGGERLRRRSRGRADLPRDRRALRQHQADPPALAAVDDRGRDPRRLRAFEAGRGAGESRPLQLALARSPTG